MKKKIRLSKSFVYSLMVIVGFFLLMFLSDYLEKQDVYHEAKQPSEDALIEFLKVEKQVEVEPDEYKVVYKEIEFKSYFENSDIAENDDYCDVTYIFEIDGEKYEVATLVGEIKGGWRYISNTSTVKQLTQKTSDGQSVNKSHMNKQVIRL